MSAQVGLASIKITRFFTILGSIGNLLWPIICSILANVGPIEVGLANIKVIRLFTILAICVDQFCVQYWAISINAGLTNIKIRLSTILSNIGNLH